MRLNRGRLAREIRRGRGPFLSLIALTAVAAIAGALMLSRQMFVSPLGDYYRVDMPVSSAKSVLEGKTEVHISGVRVGLVERVRLVAGRPVLTLALDARHAPLYRDATARLGIVTPFQDMFVALERGRRRSGRIPDGGSLRPGSSFVGVDPGDVLNAFTADTRARLATLLDQLGRGLPDGGVRLRQAFGELVPFMETARAVTRELSRQRRAVSRIVHNFGALTEALGVRDRQLTTLVDAGNAALAELARRDPELAATIAELAPTLEATREAFVTIQAAERDLDPALRKLRPSARQLAGALTALERLARNAEPALRRLQPAARELSPLARTVRSTAEGLRDAFVQVGPRAPSLDRLTSALVPCMGPITDLATTFTSATQFEGAKGGYWRIENTLGVDTVGGGAPDPTLRPIRVCAEGER